MSTKIFYRRHYKLALCEVRNKSRLFLRRKHLNVVPLLLSSTRARKVRGSFEFNLNRHRYTSLIRGRGIVPTIGEGFKLLDTTPIATQVVLGLRSYLAK